MSLSMSWERTDWTLMTERLIATVKGGCVPRRMASLISLPIGPRIFWTASLRLMPDTGWPSMATIRSPGLSPALAAGVPSIGDTTFTRPLSIVFDAEAAELALYLDLHLAEL